MMPRLSVNNLCVVDIKENCLLIDKVSLSVEAGRCLCLIGQSGGGKSLLLQSINGTLAPNLRATGELNIIDTVLKLDNQSSIQNLWAKQIGTLVQEPWASLNPTMKSLDQVAEAWRYSHHSPGLSWQASKAKAMAQLSEVGLTNIADHLPFMLSGGMAQRIAFAAVRATQAPIFLIDEPTKGLDQQSIEIFIEILQKTMALGASVIIISHDTSLAKRLNGAVSVMKNGSIVESFKNPKALLATTHPYTQELLKADTSAWQAKKSSGAPSRPNLISASNITHRFSRRELFREINLNVGVGEAISIVGDSGVGKSTLGNIMIGLQKPSGGSVMRSQSLRTLGAQKLYQDPRTGFAPLITLEKHLNDLTQLHGLAWPEVERLMNHVSLNLNLLQRLPHEVSGGELQRIAIVRILLMKPQIVLADEPTSRLDLLSQQETLLLLEDELTNVNSALILITHDVGIARRFTSSSLKLP
jgi:peptide/nickel transport system ATP-binding protein